MNADVLTFGDVAAQFVITPRTGLAAEEDAEVAGRVEEEDVQTREEIHLQAPK